MNKVLIVDVSDADRRLMSGLLVKSGYELIAVDSRKAAKDEVTKLPPGAVSLHTTTRGVPASNYVEQVRRYTPW